MQVQACGAGGEVVDDGRGEMTRRGVRERRGPRRRSGNVHSQFSGYRQAALQLAVGEQVGKKNPKLADWRISPWLRGVGGTVVVDGEDDTRLLVGL